MKKILLTLAALASLSGTVAVAQPAPVPPPGWDAGAFWRGAPDSPRQRIQFLQDRINRGIGDGSLDRREAMSANRELDRIRQMDRRMHYDNGGRLNPRDRAVIQGRLDDLSRRIRWARRNW
jgi:hypothetical protein